MKKNFGKFVGVLALATTLGLGTYVASSTNAVNAAAADGTEQLDGGWEANQGNLSLKKNKAANMRAGLAERRDQTARSMTCSMAAIA